MAEGKYDTRRINQEGERLFTVRPRYNAVDRNNPRRGEVCTIRLTLPKDLTNDDISKIIAGAPSHEANALRQMFSESGYINFLVSDIGYSMTEKHQVFHTFGGRESVYFYGHNPVDLQLSGLVIDDLDNDQFVRFVTLYNNHIRGTKAAKNFALVQISTPNATFFGSIRALQINQNAARDTDVGFSMSFIAKKVIFRSTDTYFMGEDGQLKDSQNETFFESARNQIPTYTQSQARKKSADLTARINGTSVTMSGVDKTDTLGIGGTYTRLVDSLPDLKDLLGITPEELANIFSSWLSVITDPLKQIADEINGVVDYVRNFTYEVDAYLGAVEGAVDEVLGAISSVTNAIEYAESTVDYFQDWAGDLVNFPESIADKIGSFIDNGLLITGGGTGDSSAQIIGGSYVSSADAEAILRMKSRANPGPIRGTPQGTQKAAGKTADDSAVIDVDEI